MKRTLILIVVPPLAVAVAVIVALVAIAPLLPHAIAVHWGRDGVDGTGTVADLIVPVAVTVPLVTAFVVLLVLVTSRRGSSTVLERSAIVVSVFAGAGTALSILAVVIPQRNAATLDDIHPAPWIVGAFAVALVLAAGCALSSRPVPVVRPTLVGGPALELSETERAVWSHSVTARTGVQVLVLACGVLVVVVVWIAGLAWIALPEAILFAVVIAMLHWRVTVTRQGILARSAFGLPRFRVPTADIVEARVIRVNPLLQFGGWGIRVGGTGWGVIMRAGDAIEVVRNGRSSFFVTVDDAATGAALLNGFARERHPQS
jgi:hypothetical protein